MLDPLKTECIRSLNLDIVGLAETHLVNKKEINFEGYTWFGQNRTGLHNCKARRGSGGIGLLIKNSLLTLSISRRVMTRTKAYCGLILVNKQSQQSLKICVCYLVPAFSTRNVNAQDFMDKLLCQIQEYQKDSKLMIFGDFNTRLGDAEDFIAGIDKVPHREVIDFQRNSYCDILIDFLISTNMCVLNGRNSLKDDYTFISSQGGSLVIDYCFVTYEDLELYDNFEVHRIRTLIQEIFEAGSVTSGHLPDHSFLTWEYRLPDEIAHSETTSNDNSCFIKYNYKKYTE